MYFVPDNSFKHFTCTYPVSIPTLLMRKMRCKEAEQFTQSWRAIKCGHRILTQTFQLQSPVSESVPQHCVCQGRPEEGDEGARQILWGRAVIPGWQEIPIMVLRWQCVYCVHGTARRLLWLEWSKQGGEQQGMRAGGRRGQCDRQHGALRPWQGLEQERHWRFLSSRVIQWK